MDSSESNCHLNEDRMVRKSLVLSGSFRKGETESKAGNRKNEEVKAGRS